MEPTVTATEATNSESTHNYITDPSMEKVMKKDIPKDMTPTHAKTIPEEIIPQKLKDARVTLTSINDSFVHRPETAAKLDFAMNTDMHGYWIVYGPMGMGKSELVEHTVKDKSAVVMLTVCKVDSKEELIGLLMKELGVEDDLKLDLKKLQNRWRYSLDCF